MARRFSPPMAVVLGKGYGVVLLITQSKEKDSLDSKHALNTSSYARSRLLAPKVWDFSVSLSNTPIVLAFIQARVRRSMQPMDLRSTPVGASIHFLPLVVILLALDYRT